jgi:hypothetical protein
LLNDGQDVTPELSHLAVVFLDHLGASDTGRPELFLLPIVAGFEPFNLNA